MSYVSGDGKPRRKIVLFLIGAFVVFASAYIAIDVASTFGLPFLTFFRFGVLVGLGIQIFALFRMIVYDKGYILSFIMGIIAFLCVSAFLVATTLDFIGVITFTTEGTPYLTLSLIDTVAESIMMIFFIVATEHLAEQSYHGMPKLTIVLVVAYIILLLLEIAAFVAQLAHFTIPWEWLATILFEIQKISSIIKLIGTLIFVISALVYIKD